MPYKLLKESLATQTFLFPELTLLSLPVLIIVWLITSTDKGTDIKGRQGVDKQAVRKWLRVGGAKGRTKLPGGWGEGSSFSSLGRSPLPSVLEVCALWLVVAVPFQTSLKFPCRLSRENVQI